VKKNNFNLEFIDKEPDSSFVTFEHLKIFCSNRRNGNMSFAYGDSDEVEKNRQLFFKSVNIDINRTCNFKILNGDLIKDVREYELDGLHSISKKDIKTDALIIEQKKIVFLHCFWRLHPLFNI